MAMKEEAETLRLALICGCASTQTVKEWAVAQIQATSTPDAALIDLVSASDRISDVVTLLGRIPGRPAVHEVASALARRMLASIQDHPTRARTFAEHVEQIVRSGEWPEAVHIDIHWITDGFALAEEGLWTYDQALSNFKSALVQISGDR